MSKLDAPKVRAPALRISNDFADFLASTQNRVGPDDPIWVREDHILDYLRERGVLVKVVLDIECPDCGATGQGLTDLYVLHPERLEGDHA